MNILALDPGTHQTGIAIVRNGSWLFSVVRNESVLALVERSHSTHIAIEMIASYGMPVGAEVFETCVWIGRFYERWMCEVDRTPPILVYRKDVKMHLCGTPRAKDGNIRQALIDKIGPVGTKKAPGPLYGCSSHAWAALGVAVTALHQLEEGK